MIFYFFKKKFQAAFSGKIFPDSDRNAWNGIRIGCPLIAVVFIENNRFGSVVAARTGVSFGGGKPHIDRAGCRYGRKIRIGAGDAGISTVN